MTRYFDEDDRRPDAVNEDLLDAISSGNMPAVERAIAYGADPSYNKSEPLNMAVSLGQTSMAHLLCEVSSRHGGRRAQIEDVGERSFQRALHNGYAETLAFLLARGYPLRQGDHEEILVLGVRSGYMPLVGYVLTREKEQEGCSHPGDHRLSSVLSMAIGFGQYSMVPKLIGLSESAPDLIQSEGEDILLDLTRNGFVSTLSKALHYFLTTCHVSDTARMAKAMDKGLIQCETIFKDLPPEKQEIIIEEIRKRSDLLVLAQNTVYMKTFINKSDLEDSVKKDNYQKNPQRKI